LPTQSEWTTLIDYLGGLFVAGGKMKETGVGLNWLAPNECATNSSGFTGYGGGNRDSNGSWNITYQYGYWWSSTEDANGAITVYGLTWAYCRVVGPFTTPKKFGCSVRCVKN
jgi:uncharacterized protein (TIGR02145 family)